MTDKPISKVVIVGGGSAGWLVAGILAADHQAHLSEGLDITVIASPQVSTIGVGEGTWPTMRATLERIGISETQFIRQCDATFKQGSQFRQWVNGQADDSYYHPFTIPVGYDKNINLAMTYQQVKDRVSFCNAVTTQGYVCDRDLAPKLNSHSEFDGSLNYGYHLDALKFAKLLQSHCCSKLGVTFIEDHITGVNSDITGDIESLSTTNHGELKGDFYIDCSGLGSLLLGRHFNIGFNSQKSVLFNDSAIVTQVPYENEHQEIASCTRSTAQSAGWVWDIGLTSRRGVGYTFSSAHSNDEQAEQTLRAYLGDDKSQMSLRKISFNPGFREKFWHKNCVAVGLSAGFIEPLEASALVMIELAASKISDELPARRCVMDITAQRFNDQFSYRWHRIIDFLKLHYAISQRSDSDYWIDNRCENSMPSALQQNLALWQHHAPWFGDFVQQDEIFSPASYQYVLYGMGFHTQGRTTGARQDKPATAFELFSQVNSQANQLAERLKGHRQTLNNIHQYGMQKI